MNIVLTPFGAMPQCHGAGGLAGQHKFGARSSVGVLGLGMAKMFLGAFFGRTLLSLLQAFPESILGV